MEVDNREIKFALLRDQTIRSRQHPGPNATHVPSNYALGMEKVLEHECVSICYVHVMERPRIFS